LAGGYAIPLISAEGPPLDAYIVHCQAELSARERDDRNWAADSLLWLSLFQQDRKQALARMFDPYSGRFNTVAWRAWWHGRNIDSMLAAYGL
jgi:hypothetical protein